MFLRSEEVCEGGHVCARPHVSYDLGGDGHGVRPDDHGVCDLDDLGRRQTGPCGVLADLLRARCLVDAHRSESAVCLVDDVSIGAAIGAVLGHLSKRHEEKKLGVELDEYLPAGSSAVVAVVDEMYADKVEGALVKSDKRINKAIDKDDYDALQKAISKSADEVSDAITS